MRLLNLLRATSGLLLISIISSCNDDLDVRTLDEDIAEIEQYIADNNLNATRSDDWNVYYIEEIQGNGRTASNSSIVEIAYESSLLESAVFDSDSSYTFAINSTVLLQGFARAALTLSEGGKSTFLIPSVYAYGPNSGELNGVNIPPNAIIKSDITLKAILTTTQQRLREEDLILDYFEALGNDTIDGNADGLFKQIITEGDGDSPSSGSRVLLSYEGTFLDGEEFDKSDEAGVSFTLDPNGLIEGFLDAVLSMKEGEEALFALTSNIAYGERGTPTIPPFTPLVFKIKLINI
ncbi:MAG: FKBP-type peptidyl-prolyl cis-trans isomerase [Bacteroidota bacterium]